MLTFINILTSVQRLRFPWTPSPKCTTKNIDFIKKLCFQKTFMKVSSSFLVICSCSNYFSQNEFHSEMFYQHLLYLKKCTLPFTPYPLVYALYACGNVDNCDNRGISVNCSIMFLHKPSFCSTLSY